MTACMIQFTITDDSIRKGKFYILLLAFSFLLFNFILYEFVTCH